MTIGQRPARGGKGSRDLGLRQQHQHRGAGHPGAEVVSDGRLDLANTRISVQGADARGISSYAVQAGSRNSITLTRGSRVETQDGVALLAAGGDHVFRWTAPRSMRVAQARSRGVLLRSQSTGQASDLRVPSGSVANAISPRAHPAGRRGFPAERRRADRKRQRGHHARTRLGADWRADRARRRPRQPSGAGCVQRLERARRFLAGGAGQRRHGRVRGAGRQGRLQDPDSQSVHRWRVTGAEYAAGR